MEQIFFVLIGDVIASKAIAPSRRNEIQLELDRILEEINDDHSFTGPRPKALLTLGDEFQAVFFKMDDLLNALFQIKLSFLDVHFRFGIGLGQIFTPEKEVALGMDGPAFWNARKAMEEAHLPKHKRNDLQSNIILHGMNDISLERLINATLALCDNVSSRWGQGQRRSIKIILKNKWEIDSIKLKCISETSNVNVSTVSRILKSSSYANFSEALSSISYLVERDISMGVNSIV